jgi:hypothetical protein
MAVPEFIFAKVNRYPSPFVFNTNLFSGQARIA